MKKYIKPSILTLEAEASTLMSGSISDNGNSGDFYNPGTAGASSARVKRRKIDSPWDYTWDSDNGSDDE